jgi:hypothetical protein
MIIKAGLIAGLLLANATAVQAAQSWLGCYARQYDRATADSCDTQVLDAHDCRPTNRRAWVSASRCVSSTQRAISA